jgi:hypothetical protein
MKTNKKFNRKTNLTIMERKMIITYNWWRIDDEEEIKDSHKEALEESAIERIEEQRRDGMTSGELYDNIEIDDEDGEGIEYRGWWETTIITE